MLLAQHHLYDGIVKDLATQSPNYGVNDGVNGDKSVHSASQKVAGPKIINAPKNDLIKIVSYDVNLKVAFLYVYTFFSLFTLSHV